jgi:hypothetical protein
MNRLRVCQVYISHINHVIEHFSFCGTYKSPASPGLAKQIMYILRILCYNGSLVTGSVVSLTAAKCKSLIFSLSGFALYYAMNMFILMILYDFCLSLAQFYYIIVYLRKVESCVQIADRCAPWKLFNGAESLGLQALQL